MMTMWGLRLGGVTGTASKGKASPLLKSPEKSNGRRRAKIEFDPFAIAKFRGLIECLAHLFGKIFCFIIWHSRLVKV